jgi:hypothetical protein
MRLRTVLFVTGLMICLVSLGFAVSRASAGSGPGVEARVLLLCRLTTALVWLVTIKLVLV